MHTLHSSSIFFGPELIRSSNKDHSFSVCNTICDNAIEMANIGPSDNQKVYPKCISYIHYRKFKSVRERWLSTVRNQNVAKPIGINKEKVLHVDRGYVIKVSMKAKTEHKKDIKENCLFRVIVVLDKFYNKLFMSEQ